MSSPSPLLLWEHFPRNKGLGIRHGQQPSKDRGDRAPHTAQCVGRVGGGLKEDQQKRPLSPEEPDGLEETPSSEKEGTTDKEALTQPC